MTRALSAVRPASRHHDRSARTPRPRASGCLRVARAEARLPARNDHRGARSDRFSSRSSGPNALALPELYDSLPRRYCPPASGDRRSATWSGIESYVPAFLAAAAKQNHLSDLAEAVGRAVGGPAGLGRRQGPARLDRGPPRATEKARDRLLPLIESKEAPIPSDVRRVLVRELAGAAELHDLALRLVDGESESKLANGLASYQGSLTRIHVNLYRSVGRSRRGAGAGAQDVPRRCARPRRRKQQRDSIDDSGASTRSAGSFSSSTPRSTRSESTVRSSNASRDDQADELGTTSEWESIASGVERALQAVRTADRRRSSTNWFPRQPLGRPRRGSGRVRLSARSRRAAC